MAAPVRSLVKSLIDANKVMVFSKSYCPFCMMAKDVLKEAGVNKMKVLEIEERDDAFHIQDILREMTGVSTVPSVFINHKYVGGGTKLQEMFEEGELQKILREHGLLNASNSKL
ncbi:uncharacterized protein [Amphiura filiformis]|uniref:uncharacterized protein n=1 Tax=Amphiura filiformis TaxID=82378 RepID=UPI003B225A96